MFAYVQNNNNNETSSNNQMLSLLEKVLEILSLFINCSGMYKHFLVYYLSDIQLKKDKHIYESVLVKNHSDISNLFSFIIFGYLQKKLNKHTE